VIYSQRVTPPVRTRWIDRVLGIAVGSLVTAWFLRRDPEPMDAVEAAEPVVAPAAAVRPTPEPIPVAVAAATLRAAEPMHAAAPVATAEVRTVVEPIVDAEPSRIEAEPSRIDAEPSRTASDAASRSPDPDRTPPGDAPLLPLPRMPGDTRLSSSARFDAATESWILKAAFRVHARDHHVLAFYRKALADQGLTVTHSEDPPTADGAVKTYLHGKSARVHAQVGILPRTDALETRVWILWRSRD
jgi:hypothetical protein